MPNLIDRTTVLQRLCAECSNMGSFICMSCKIPEIVKGIPKIEAEPVRYGMWQYDLPNAIFVCSECHMMYRDNPNYCPRCGARMGVSEDESK